MPEIGGVEYGDVAFEFMGKIAAQRTLEGTLPGTLANEAAVIHALHQEFPGVMMLPDDLPSPDENRIGKFHGPDAGAPTTEREAAISVYPNSGTARRRVLDYIGAAGTPGATDEEISLALDMRLYTAAPRRNELLNDGWIRDSGRTRPTTTGTRAVVWVMTEAGRAQWSPPS